MISEGLLLCVDKESLDNVGVILDKHCVNVVVNEVISTRILAITKKREICIFDFEDAPFGFKLFDKKIILPDFPLQITFFNEKIFFTTHRKDYYYFDINTSVEPIIFKDVPKNQQVAQFKIINEEEIFLVTSNNTGIFLTVTTTTTPSLFILLPFQLLTL